MKIHKPPFHLRELKIEVTYRCPLTCIHCSSDANPSKNLEISREKCLDILKEAIKMDVKEVVFSGGEPLLWPYIEEAVALVASNNLKVILYTCGNVENIDLRLYNLKEKGLQIVIFSIFGSEASSHERITRSTGSFDVTIKAISHAIKEGLHTELHFVPLSENYKCLKDIAKLGKTWGISNISILRFVPHGRGHLLRKSILTKLQHIELKKIIEDLRSEGYNIRTGSPFNFLMLNDDPKCYCGIDRMIISPDLQIHPCDAFKQIKSEDIVKESKFSSLNTATLDECWQKSSYFKAVRDYLTSDFSRPCKSCKCLDKCLSGCLAQKVIEYGDFKKRPDPMCLLS